MRIIGCDRNIDFTRKNVIVGKRQSAVEKLIGIIFGNGLVGSSRNVVNRRIGGRLRCVNS